MYRKFCKFTLLLVWIGESEHAKDESSPWWRDVTLLAQHTLGRPLVGIFLLGIRIRKYFFLESEQKCNFLKCFEALYVL